jgi:hypothetical protein
MLTPSSFFYDKDKSTGWTRKDPADRVVRKRGILGHQFNKTLDSFAPCCSQSHLLADFKE